MTHALGSGSSQDAIGAILELKRRLAAGEELSAEGATPLVTPAQQWLFQNKGNSALIRDVLWPALTACWDPGADKVAARLAAANICDQVIIVLAG
jgi:hypothetical protein